MNLNLTILNASSNLNSLSNDINETFNKTIERIKNLFPVKNVDIVVWNYPEWTINQYGIGGHTMTPHTIFISIDPNNSNIKKLFKDNFSRTIIHELHHVARMQALGNEYATRLETSIREGLAHIINPIGYLEIKRLVFQNGPGIQ